MSDLNRQIAYYEDRMNESDMPLDEIEWLREAARLSEPKPGMFSAAADRIEKLERENAALRAALLALAEACEHAPSNDRIFATMTDAFALLKKGNP